MIKTNGKGAFLGLIQSLGAFLQGIIVENWSLGVTYVTPLGDTRPRAPCHSSPLGLGNVRR